MDRIRLLNMMFYAYHGVYDAEAQLGQRFFIDVELEVDTSEAGRTDDLARTTNYVGVYSLVRDIVEKRRFNLIEALAETIAQEILAGFSVEGVVVRVRKPDVPIGGLLDAVEVEIARRRTAPSPASMARGGNGL